MVDEATSIFHQLSAGPAAERQSTGKLLSGGLGVKVEIHINFDWAVTRRMTILNGWLKAPFLDRFDRFFIEAHPQAAADAYVAGGTIGLNNNAHHAKPLELGLARLFRELWIDLRNHSRVARHFPDCARFGDGEVALALIWVVIEAEAHP